MKSIKLIYFEGCPNADRVRNSLAELGREFVEVRQDELPEHHPLKGYTSPTILKNDKIVFGQITESAGACSLQIPSTSELHRNLGED